MRAFYCLSPETPVLGADGRYRAIADLAVGDRIVGTERRGTYRRFVATEVHDRWWTVKPAFRVILADGTELVASGDHRFLTRRGWKHVIGAEQGRARRPHLTLGSELLGLGRMPETPPQTRDYKIGYLTGMVRGDAYPALADAEALDRSVLFLDELGVATKRFALHGGTGTLQGGHHSGIRILTRWPLDPSDEWCRGFLAGIFDAEGSCSNGILRIANGDAMILRWIETSLRVFGFDSAREGPNAIGISNVRLRGGMSAQQRFFHVTDTAISRKRSLEGRAIKKKAELEVVAIEPVGTRRLVDITTGTGDFIADGVVSHNCFARPTHKYLDFNAGRDFEKEIVVKVNAPEVLRAQLRKPSWTHEHVAMGTNTDPYQWVESKYRLMPGIWEALRDARNPCSILTKSPLLLRDKELLVEIAEVASVSAAFSIPTIDREAWRASEPHTPSPWARMEAVAELNRLGIPTGILIAPLMPGINDDPRDIERILEAAGEAGAVSIGGIALHLRGEVRGVFMDWLRSYRPDLVERYEQLYARGAYAPEAERARLSALLRRSKVPPRADFTRDPQQTAPSARPSGWRQVPDGEAQPSAGTGRSRPAPRQEALF